MADKLMYISDYNTHNYPVKTLLLFTFGPQLNEPNNRNAIKVPNYVEPTNKKMLLQNFGDYCNTIKYSIKKSSIL